MYNIILILVQKKLKTMLTLYAKFWIDNKEYCGNSNPSEICHGTIVYEIKHSVLFTICADANIYGVLRELFLITLADGTALAYHHLMVIRRESEQHCNSL